MKKGFSKALSVLIAAILIFSVSATPFFAMTSTEQREASKAREQLANLMSYYERYIVRVTLDKYKQVAEYQNYVNILMPHARALLAQDELEPASVYSNMENTLENSWTTWRMQMPISRGIGAMWKDKLDKTPLYSSYTRSSINRFLSDVDIMTSRIDLLMNSTISLDEAGQRTFDKFADMLASLKPISGNPETDCIEATADEAEAAATAKTTLADEIKEYEEMDISAENTVFHNRLLLLQNLLKTDTLYAPEEYATKGVFGIQFAANSDKIVHTSALKKIEDAYNDHATKKAAYSTSVYKRFLKYYADKADEMLKICTDATTTDVVAESKISTILSAQPTLVANSGVSSKEAQRDELMLFMAIIEMQADRDTKTVKSPETLQLLQTVSNAADVVADYLVLPISKMQSAYSEMENCCEQIFQPALPVGTPFSKIAQRLFYSVASNSADYTTASWAAVSAAMDYCDYIKNDGFDFECAEAYAELKKAIDNLQLRVKPDVKFTVSSAEGNLSDTVTLNVNVSEGSRFAYGQFNIGYNSEALEFISSDCRDVMCGADSVLCKPDMSETTAAQTLFSLTFKIKDDATSGDLPIYLSVDKARDGARYLIENITTQNGEIIVNSGIDLSFAMKVFLSVAKKASLSEGQAALADQNGDGKVSLADAMMIFMIVADKPVLKTSMSLVTDEAYSITFDTQGAQESNSQIPATAGTAITVPEIPTKEGYVFEGWYTEPNGEGEKILSDNYYAFRTQTFYARWDIFEARPLEKRELMLAGYVAIHSIYAVEEDFRMLHDNGINLIILDYFRGGDEAICKKTLDWADKYGIRAYISDPEMLSMPLSEWTPEKIQQMTSDYSSHACFIGNFLQDEPGLGAIPELGKKVEAYIAAMPKYDMHMNVFSIAEYVNSAIQNTPIKVVSSDPYPLRQSPYGERTTSPGYFTELQSCADPTQAAGRDGCTYIQTMTGGVDSRITNLADIRFQMYSALAFGNTMIMHYCYEMPGFAGVLYPSNGVYCMRDSMREYTILWDYGQTANTEIRALSEYIQNYSYVDTYSISGLNPPEYLSVVRSYSTRNGLSVSSDDALLLAKFHSNSENRDGYLVTNASELADNKTSTVTINAEDSISLTLCHECIEETLLPDANGNYTFTMPSGGGAFFLINK